ncbi:MAG: hypothetical protein ACKPKO_40770, partial [Candidatus Fonsibacter sp.]
FTIQRPPTEEPVAEDQVAAPQNNKTKVESRASGIVSAGRQGPHPRGVRRYLPAQEDGEDHDRRELAGG